MSSPTPRCSCRSANALRSSSSSPIPPPPNACRHGPTASITTSTSPPPIADAESPASSPASPPGGGDPKSPQVRVQPLAAAEIQKKHDITHIVIANTHRPRPTHEPLPNLANIFSIRPFGKGLPMKLWQNFHRRLPFRNRRLRHLHSRRTSPPTMPVGIHSSHRKPHDVPRSSATSSATSSASWPSKSPKSTPSSSPKRSPNQTPLMNKKQTSRRAGRSRSRSRRRSEHKPSAQVAPQWPIPKKVKDFAFPSEVFGAEYFLSVPITDSAMELARARKADTA